MLIRKLDTAVRTNARLARRGFTLMEVLIVVAIIVALAGVGTFYLMPMLTQSKEGIARTQCKTIEQACNTFMLNNDRYPSSLAELTQPQPNGNKAILEPHAIVDPWDKPFQYDQSGPKNGGNKVDVFTTSPDGKIIGNWTKGK